MGYEFLQIVSDCPATEYQIKNFRDMRVAYLVAFYSLEFEEFVEMSGYNPEVVYEFRRKAYALTFGQKQGGDNGDKEEVEGEHLREGGEVC